MKDPDQSEDFEQLLLESLDELHTEAQITSIDLEFPLEVIERLEIYVKEHSLDRAELLNLAIDAHVDPTGACWVEVVCRQIDAPDPFEWPLEDPLRCVIIAFMRKLAYRCASKVHEKPHITDDEDDPADWWKAVGS
jgi:hypothetical protein